MVIIYMLTHVKDATLLFSLTLGIFYFNISIKKEDTGVIPIPSLTYQ